MAKNILFIESSAIETISNKSLEIVIAENSSIIATVTNFIVMKRGSQTASDFVNYICNNLTDIDVVITMPEYIIICKLKK